MVMRVNVMLSSLMRSGARVHVPFRTKQTVVSFASTSRYFYLLQNYLNLKIRNKHARHKAIPILMTVRIVQLMRIRHRHWARSAHQVIHIPSGANGVHVHPIVPMSTMQRNERKHEHVSASPIQLPMKTRGVMSRMTVLSWRRHKTVRPIFAPFVPISPTMPSVPSDPIPSALIRRRMAPPEPHASVKRHTSEFLNKFNSSFKTSFF